MIKMNGHCEDIVYLQKFTGDEYQRKLRLITGAEVALPSSPCKCGVAKANYYYIDYHGEPCLRVKDGLLEYIVDIPDCKHYDLSDKSSLEGNRPLMNLVEEEEGEYLGRVEVISDSPVFVPAGVAKEEVF